jgi:hypothetical protein
MQHSDSAARRVNKLERARSRRTPRKFNVGWRASHRQFCRFHAQLEKEKLSHALRGARQTARTISPLQIVGIISQWQSAQKGKHQRAGAGCRCFSSSTFCGSAHIGQRARSQNIICRPDNTAWHTLPKPPPTAAVVELIFVIRYHNCVINYCPHINTWCEYLASCGSASEKPKVVLRMHVGIELKCIARKNSLQIL